MQNKVLSRLYIICHSRVLYCWPFATKLTWFLKHVQGMLCTEFQEIPRRGFEILLRSYLVCQIRCLCYWPISEKLPKFAGHVQSARYWRPESSLGWGVDGAEKVLPSPSKVPLNTDRWQPNVRKNPSNETRETAQSVFCSPSKVLCITCFSQPNWDRVGNAPRILGGDFQENTSNGSRDTDVNVMCSSRKVPFITGRSQITVICRQGT